MACVANDQSQLSQWYIVVVLSSISYHIEEEVPSHCKTKSTVHPLAAEPNKRGRHRKIRHHLGEAFVDCPHHASPDNEADEEACGSAFGECRAHLDVQRFQRSASIDSALNVNAEASSEVIIRETNRFRWLHQSRIVELPFPEGSGARTASQRLYRQHCLEQYLHCCHYSGRPPRTLAVWSLSIRT